ncbi:alkylglycerol monooxygenase-like [Tropilaelaps mercedesae]|uniref:Alkylglycerol monooxygenase-like n=1 Tax=Tropilaelaps mercedesae TaxID=418985 RepID=A0A1V9XN16_9ACAR|nr:alkylglycerol monooxygenase-like [Tropilaelaps mercedesae]
MALLSASWQQLSERANCSNPKLCRLENSYNNLGLHMRFLLMAVHPAEVLTEENLSPLKDLANECTPSFAIFVLLEYIIVRLLRGRWPHLGEYLPNIYNGGALQSIRLAFHVAEFYVYNLIYHQWHWQYADTINWKTWPAWITLTVVLDLCYYIFHRSAHEMAVFWTMHQVHHSSDFFNLSISFRIPHLHDFVHSGVFYMPLAMLGVPVEVTFVNKTLNLLYQFWTHTEAIPKLPWPIEYVFNTPSHHRVHHARQAKYLDKNYGSFLIIWDRMFGTFCEEEEQPIYGLTTPQRSVNFIYYQFAGIVELHEKVRSMKGWKNKLQCLVKGPGWKPGSPWTGYLKNVPTPDPADEPQFVTLTWFWQLFLVLDFSLSLALFGLVLIRYDQIPRSVLYIAIVVFYAQGYCAARVLEGNPLAAPLQAAKFASLSFLSKPAWDIFGRFTPCESLILSISESIAFSLFVVACIHVSTTFTDRLSTKILEPKLE